MNRNVIPEEVPMTEDLFKRCSFCGREWDTRGAFLADPEIEFIGYQSFVDEGILGLFLFNHEPCHTTLTVSAKKFADLHGGTIYKSRDDFAEADPHCLSSTDGHQCPEACECGFVRKIIGMIEDGRPA